jgi:hypothetical protein
MFERGRLKLLAALVVAAAAFGVAQGSACAFSFSAPLVQCSAVTTPAALSNCGSDPFGKGVATINDEGDVEVEVTGAAASQTYAILFRSPNGASSTQITDKFVTDAKGHGRIRKENFFVLGKVGAGNLALTRSGLDQYVTGLAVASSPAHGGPGLVPALVRCADVNVPAALASCGSDPLTRGSVDIEGDDGDLTIQVHGAAAAKSYTAVLRAPNGTEHALGTVNTDSKGAGVLIQSSAFAAGTIGSGTVVLERAGSDQYFSGFKVTEKSKPPTVSQASLVRCSDVSTSNLANCGSDPLDQGNAQIVANGQVHVVITGAEASISYEVFFRPIDNSGDLDTGLSLNTGPDGNANGSIFFFKSNTIGSGNVVLKRTGLDQFVTGFDIR